MLPEIKELYDRLDFEPREDEMAYLLSINGAEDLGNFTDPGDGSLIALAWDAAIALGFSHEQADKMEAQWAKPVAHTHTEQPKQPNYDFSSSGLGMGGLSTYEEQPIIPTIAQIDHAQHLMDTDIICRKCGASMNFDGAMFTTGGCDICDDCF